jgi:two-component system NarL family response regulator
MSTIRIFIVDDNFIARRGLRSALESEKELYITGEASSGAEALKALRDKAADIVLMDIRMGEMDGIKTTQALKRIQPDVKVLIMTVIDDPIVLAHVLNAGAAGYLVYGHFTPQDLTAAVRNIATGGLVRIPPLEELFPSLKFNQQPLDAEARLTSREIEVLKLIASGCENREIAEILHIEEKTVKNHINNIYSKLNITSRQQAVLYMLKELTS